MSEEKSRYAPGRVRDGIVQVMSLTSDGPYRQGDRGARIAGRGPGSFGSSVRSYLSLNTPEMFTREERGVYTRLTLNTLPPAYSGELSQGRLK